MLWPLHSSHFPSAHPSGLPENGHWMTVPTGTLPPAGATAVTEGGENELLSAASTGQMENAVTDVAVIRIVSNRMINLLFG